MWYTRTRGRIIDILIHVVYEVFLLNGPSELFNPTEYGYSWVHIPQIMHEKDA